MHLVRGFIKKIFYVKKNSTWFEQPFCKIYPRAFWGILILDGSILDNRGKILKLRLLSYRSCRRQFYSLWYRSVVTQFRSSSRFEHDVAQKHSWCNNDIFDLAAWSKTSQVEKNTNTFFQWMLQPIFSLLIFRMNNSRNVERKTKSDQIFVSGGFLSECSTASPADVRMCAWEREGERERERERERKGERDLVMRGWT